MNNKVSTITYENSNKIKGIALFMMFFHHFLTFPDWYVNGWTYSGINFIANYFNMPTQLTVSIFAFLTGYCYASHKDKSIRYSLRKGFSLYIQYWILILLTVLMIEILSHGQWSMDAKNVILNFLCIRQDLSFFGWYVSFYFISMLLISVIEKFTDHSHLFYDVVLYIFIPALLFTVMQNVISSQYTDFWNFFYRLYNMFPVMGCGIICSEYSIFEKSFDHGFKKTGRTLKIFWLIVLTVLVFVSQYFSRTVTLLHVGILDYYDASVTVSMGIIYAPILVYCFDRLMTLIQIPFLDKIVDQLGKNSMLMWLISGVFFTQVLSSSGFQSLVTLPKNPVLVLFWSLVLCYIPAVILKKPLRKISDAFTRWLK